MSEYYRGQKIKNWAVLGMANQLSYSQREARDALLRRRESYFAIQKILSRPSRDEEGGNLECVHCHNRFTGVTAAAWKFGLCDNCLHHD
ncbi:hypothetical protein ACHMW7_25530 [Aminobacter sp. UC22_36]|uniref:hypothetical protein n=1 Tax=Aminobacter sp. UC22_36 TaxID=3374549 RepID=UPI0037573704